MPRPVKLRVFGEFLGMTTASPRAVSGVSFSRLRTALLAATSTSLMVALSAPANAASCATTAIADNCVISLTNANTLDNHDGNLGVDTLTFGTGAVEALAYTNTSFTTAGTAQFISFENAVVASNATLSLTDASAGDISRDLNWTIQNAARLILNNGSTAASDANDSIGNSSAITVSAGGFLDNYENERIGALSGAGQVNLFGGTLTVLAGNNTFSGLITGPGNLGLVGLSGSKWILSSNNDYTGTTTITSGGMEIGHAGAIDQSSAINITGGELTGKVAYTINAPVTITTSNALSRLTGNATINGNVSSNGGLQPGNTSIPPGSLVENPGQDMGTITINGNYQATGASAYVGMFINIDAAAPLGGTPGVTHDFLDINGSINGTERTMFSLSSFLPSPTGAPTTGNGIQVIRVSGASSASNFFQGSAMNAGPYQYLLKHVPDYAGVGTADGFFLQSATRDELIAQAAILSAGQELVRNCYHDGQRVPDSPKGATYGRAWIGYRQGSSNFGADTGIDSNVDFSCTTGGMDWRMGGGWFGGISGGFGDTEGSIQTPAGTGTYLGTGRAAEVFASFTSSALFINLSAGYNAMDYTYNGALLFPILANTSGFLARAETGVALDLDAVAVKLIGAISYDGTNCSDSCLGVAVQQDTGLIEAKGTVRIDGVAHSGSVRPWIAASFSDVLSDGINTVSLNGVSVSHDTSGQRLSLDAGMQAYLDQNFALYIDGGYHTSMSTDVTGYKAGIGLKMYW